MDKINIELKFQEYLKKVKVNKDDISQVQYSEMKKAYAAGFSDLLTIFTTQVADMSEENGAYFIDTLIQAIHQFWEKEVEEYTKTNGG